MGLIPSPNDGRRLRYDKNLDRPDIRPGVERILNNIKYLLDEAGRVDERYGLNSTVAQGSEVSTSKGLEIFKGSFERFKSRIRKHQKETSAWKVTRWAIHDADKFEGMLNRLKEFVDGLESITKSLGLLREQHERLLQEIESISDTQSLRLLRDASSRHGSSIQDVSDAASHRLITVAESFIDTQSVDSSSIFPRGTNSFVTARSRPSAISGRVSTEAKTVPGAWPPSLSTASRSQLHSSSQSKSKKRITFGPSTTCEQCQEEHYKCVQTSKGKSCSRCYQTQRVCSLKQGPVTADQDTILDSEAEAPSFREALPQNQRLLSEILRNAQPRTPLSFAAGDTHYGEQLALIKSSDEKYWQDHSAKILGCANSSSSAAKRMFFELRNIRAGKVPFVSAVPLDDSLEKVLASIEGPPETPYEGGVFWITVKLSETDPFGPPLMRFHTKIYHPNISPQGHICADYKEKWNAVLSYGTSRVPVTDPKALWYPAGSHETRWSLGDLLTAICGLLASPDVDDPLVPEIARIYLEDYESYCEYARRYTNLYATSSRPEDGELNFSEELPLDGTGFTQKDFDGLKPTPADALSLQNSLRAIYDDKISIESPTRTTSNRLVISTYAEYPPISMRNSQSEEETFKYFNKTSFGEKTTSTVTTNGSLLSRSINGQDIASRWRALGLSVAATHIEAPLDHLLVLTRDQLGSVPPLVDEVPDLDILFALLEQALASLPQTYGVLGGQKVRQFYTMAIDQIVRFLADWLKEGDIQVEVQAQDDSGSFLYHISIVRARLTSQIWSFTRTWAEIKTIATLPYQRFPMLLFYGQNISDSAFRYEIMPNPDPRVIAALLQLCFRRAFRGITFPALNSVKVLSFLRPDIVAMPATKGKNVANEYDPASEPFTRLSSLTNLGTFIWPEWFDGYPVRYRVLCTGVSETAELKLSRSFSGGFKMILSVKLQDLMNIQIESIWETELKRRPARGEQSPTPKPEDPLASSIRITYWLERGKTSNQLELIFNSPNECEDYYETIQALRHIEPMLRHAAPRSQWRTVVRASFGKNLDSFFSRR